MTFNPGSEAVDSDTGAEMGGGASVFLQKARASKVDAQPLDILTRLGSVVCIHRRAEALAVSRDVLDVLRGTRAVLRCEVEAQGPVEALCFVDGEGRSRLQVGMLPDSDFLAWEAMQDCWRVGALQVPEAPTNPVAARSPWRLTRWFASRDWTMTAGNFVLDTMGRLRLLPTSVSSACSRAALAAWAERARYGGMAMTHQCRCPRSRFTDTSMDTPLGLGRA